MEKPPANIPGQTAYHPAYQQHIKLEPNNDVQEQLAHKMANVYIPRNDDDNLKEFSVSKSDPKYQTLPYNTKFTVNLLTNNKNLKNDHNSNEKDDSNYISNAVNSNMNNVIQAAHMMVHSAPLSQVNKNIATPLNQHDLISRKNSDGKDQNLFSSGNHAKEELIVRSNKFHNEQHTYPSANSASTYQKPISSVAPTSIHHSNIPSTVYQTSSIKIQPVEPQTITTTTKPPSSVYQGNQTLPSPQGSVLSPPQSTSTPLSTPEVTEELSTPKPGPICSHSHILLQVSHDSNPKPALPPKPAIKPPPRQTQIFTEDPATRPPPLPLTEPPEDKSSPPVGAKPPTQKPTSSESATKSAPGAPPPLSEMIIKPKPLNIKKQQLSEQPKLRSLSSSSKLNGLILSNRRIELPPVFHPYAESQQQSAEKQETAQLQEKEVSKDETDRSSKSSVDETSSTDSKDLREDNVIRRIKKGNLKQTGKHNLSRRFLVEFGCDVNAQDSDGWTPLHCAASCNNLTMVRFLVEHGACIFATTLSDHETAAEKCEEDEEGAGEQFTILRKGDENEREWWWSKLGDKEGYVPRNLLGLYPRVQKTEDN
ncbi:hypothetical protein YQE_01463, partial [Dendroctonus ponderosae]